MAKIGDASFTISDWPAGYHAWRNTRPPLATEVGLQVARIVAEVVAKRDGLNPPIDIQGWCSRANVRVEWTNCAGDAYYLQAGSQGLVRAKPGGRDERRNFTIAHELGHHYLEMIRSDESLRRDFPDWIKRVIAFLEVGGTQEEKLCNLVASSLLMPESEFLREADRYTRYSLASCRRIGHRFGVSIPAVVMRFHELGLSAPDYVVCQEARGIWRVHFSTSVAAGLVRGSRLRFRSELPAPGGIAYGVSLSSAERLFECDVERHNDRVIMLVKHASGRDTVRLPRQDYRMPP